MRIPTQESYFVSAVTNWDGCQLGLSFRNRCGLTPSQFAGLAREAEDAGFEHLVFTERYNDLIAYLVAVAGTTQRACLWAGVANVGLRHPILMASGAAVVDDVSAGRFILGLGTGNEWHVGERYDTLAAKPLGLIREYVKVVRAALNNQPIAHQGPRYPVQGSHMSFAPLRANLPIYLAALGPRMAELAGEIGDGVFVHMHAPEDLSSVRSSIAVGCERIDRDPQEIKLAVLPVLCVDDDLMAARETVRESIVDYLGYDSYRRHVTRLGYAAMLKQMANALNQANVKAAASFVPDELVDRVAVYGPPDACKRKLQEYALAGADVSVLSPRPVAHEGVDPSGWEQMYKQVINQFRQFQGRE